MSRILAFTLLTLSVCILSAETERRPNLIIILADDLGYGDLSSYGSTLHHTPHIDQLAADGQRFTQFYVTSPVCTPTRVALLTGRHPYRVGFSTLLWPTTPGGLPHSERTLAEILQDNDYATALIGKWHLGHSEEKYLPMAHGFDLFYGMPYPNDMGPGHRIERIRNEQWPPMPMMKGAEIVEAPIDVSLLTQQYTAAAVNFIAQNHHQPFFLFLSHAMPHTIIGASPDFKGASRNGLYGDSVQELDWSVGEIRRTLRAFDLEEDTLVIFSSDNGAVLRSMYDNDDEARKMFPDLTFGSNAPLRGGKTRTFEGGVRLPGIFYWPGRIPSGTIHTPAWIADVMPTFLDFAEIELPDDRNYDGVTLRPLLTGFGPRQGDTFYFGGQTVSALRIGNWKIVYPKQSEWMQVDDNSPMLFNLQDDPAETTNLARDYPEKYAHMQQRLAEILQDAASDPYRVRD